MKIILVLLLFLCGCANMPTKYGQTVEITDGIHKGQIGRLVGDCSGFELYKVELSKDRRICVRAWHMEAL